MDLPLGLNWPIYKIDQKPILINLKVWIQTSLSP